MASFILRIDPYLGMVLTDRLLTWPLQVSGTLNTSLQYRLYKPTAKGQGVSKKYATPLF